MTPSERARSQEQDIEGAWSQLAAGWEDSASAGPSLLHSSLRLAFYGVLFLMLSTPFLVNGTLESSLGLYIPLCIVVLALMKIESRGYERLAGWGLCTILFSAACFGVLFFGGIKEQTPVVFTTVIVMAALCLGSRATVFFGILSGIAVVCLVRADKAGLTPTPLIPISHEDMLSSTLLNLGIVVLVMRRAVLQLRAASENLRSARSNQEMYLRSLETLHAENVERMRFARKFSDIAESVIHREFGAWRKQTLVSIQEIFGADGVGFYEATAGGQSRLAAWTGSDDPEAQLASSRLIDIAPDSQENPFAYLTHQDDPDTFGLLPNSVTSALVIAIPGRIQSQGTLIVLLDRDLELTPGLTKDIQALRSIIGSAMERTAAEQKMRIAQRMESVGRLAGSISHDFNNLLTTIMGCSQLLIDAKRTDEDDTELLQDIACAADHAALLTRQLLTLSRQQVVLVGPVDLNRAAADFCCMADRMVGESIELKFNPLRSPGFILADPSSIEQVLLNLTVNARDAMPGGGKITIDLERIARSDLHRWALPRGEPESYLALTFSDTGKGMSEYVLSHLFEPFFTTKSAGTGLGLASVREAVESLGGTLRVSSNPGTGTTFSILIPEETTAPAVPIAAENFVYEGGRGETILLVDDNDHVRKTLARVLTDSGFHVSLAHGGLEATRMLGESDTHFDLILTDIIMPSISGIEFGHRVRADGCTTPILFMSGFADARRKEVHSLGDFIAKPFTSTQLLTRIGLMLNTERAPGRHSSGRFHPPGSLHPGA